MRSTRRDGVPNSVLGRAFALLTCFGPDDGVLSLAELSRRTGIPKPTVHRMIGELTAWAVIERREDGFRLGIRLFELGQLVPRQRDLHDASLPLLRDLYQATGNTVHLAVLEGLEVMYIEKLEAAKGPPLPSRVGGRMPLHCTAVGKALLAFSPPELLRTLVGGGLSRRTPHTIFLPGLLERELVNIRRRGVAFENQESREGVVCAACPVLDSDGRALAAISISGWAHRLDTRRVAPAIHTAALAIARQLQQPGPPLPA